MPNPNHPTYENKRPKPTTGGKVPTLPSNKGIAVASAVAKGRPFNSTPTPTPKPKEAY